MRSLPKLSPDLQAALAAKRRDVNEERSDRDLAESLSSIQNIYARETTPPEGDHAMHQDDRWIAHERAQRLMSESEITFDSALRHVLAEDRALRGRLDSMYRRPCDARPGATPTKWDRQLFEGSSAPDTDPRFELHEKVLAIMSQQEGISFPSALQRARLENKELSARVDEWYSAPAR